EGTICGADARNWLSWIVVIHFVICCFASSMGYSVHGTVHDKSGKTVATLIGKWDESLHYVNGDNSGKAKEKLPRTDSRLRPDQRHLENGEYELANSEKLRLEQRQRQASRMQQMGWKPRWFARDKETEMYRYIGGY
ncbi:hypothetical protein Dimus_029333, partial [Dionaea muscipula]